MSSRRTAGIALAALAVAGAATAGIVLLFEYYRWASVPGLSCAAAEGGVEIEFASQPREWANLDPEDAARNHYVLNGSDEPGFVFDPPDGTGSLTYPPITYEAPAFPLHFALRLETISGNAPVYQSALALTCTGPGAPSGVIVNWLRHQPPRYYRWADAPPVECSPVADEVRLRFVSPEVVWRSLPEGTTLDRVYSQDGGETFDGPFGLPVGDGSAAFVPPAALQQAYPIHYAVRLDTRIGGSVAYQSVLIGSCTGDGAGTSRVVNVPEPDVASLALAALAVVVAARARSRR